MRVNRGQEFVIGGYTIGTKTFDALDLRLLRRQPLIYARARATASRRRREQLFKKFRGLEINGVPVR